MAYSRTSGEPRSTAYYYGDLERFKTNQDGGPNNGQNIKQTQKYSQSLDETRKKHGYLQHDVNSVHEIDGIYENYTNQQKYADEINIVRQHSLPKYKDNILIHKTCKSQDKRHIEDRIPNSIKEDKQNKIEIKEKQNCFQNNQETNSISEYTEALDVLQENNIELYKENIQLLNPNNRNIEIRFSNRNRRIQRQISAPECIYSTPEGIQAQSPVELINSRRNLHPNYTTPGLVETYSTAGTFPMQKEKEPLLTELEIVGRLPLSQLSTGVRRSRSWYLCCPNLEEEELSRESSWRYRSLRPITVPPQATRIVTTSQRTDSFAEELTSIRAERDSLVRALAAERQRAASVAAAQDARLAELHGVIAELMRRRTLDKQTNAIPEEDSDRSDDCESTTQPAGELENDENIDNDVTRTDQNDEETSQISAVDLPTPDDAQIRISEATDCESSSEPPLQHNVKCLVTDKRCGEVQSSVVGSSCERIRGSVTASPGGSEFRQAKLASRVKLKRTEDLTCTENFNQELLRAAEKLSLDVCAAADIREAAIAGEQSSGITSALVSLYSARCVRLQADVRVARATTQRAQDQAHRLMSLYSSSEGACLRLRLGLASADRALECYDSILALWETSGAVNDERKTAEAVATQLLHRLESNEDQSTLLSPGPWLDTSISEQTLPYDASVETKLRQHAARLKAETVALRTDNRDVHHSYLDSDNDPNIEEMEAAIAMQELCLALEKRAELVLKAARGEIDPAELGSLTQSSRRDKKKHWIETQDTSETDL